jgi:hypothetical protein
VRVFRANAHLHPAWASAREALAEAQVAAETEPEGSP